jgi:hypothetical protein
MKRFWLALALFPFLGASFTVATISVSPASAAACFSSFTTKSASNGLGNNLVYGVYVDGGNVYAATFGGLSISTDGGATFANRTTSNGLGSNRVQGVYVVGNTVYAATDGGLSISNNGGTSFTNKTTTDGLGNNIVEGVYVDSSNVYAATWGGGLSTSSDCVSSPPPSTEGAAPAQVKPPTLAETGPDLSLVLVSSGVSALFLIMGAAATLGSRRKLASVRGL